MPQLRSSLRMKTCRSSLLSLAALAAAANTCQPSTWIKVAKRAAPTLAASPHLKPKAVSNIVLGTAEPGEVNCRYARQTGKDVNYYKCTELAERYEITVEEFFVIDPGLKKDCSDIQPNTEYCVDGFIEPERASDGVCGPSSNGATCLGTDFQCCNSETWKCGDTEADCAPGTCWEGACAGDSVYSTDGTCGVNHGDRQCAGKWGDCCNFDGKCGTGTSFCGVDVCQSGNCTRPATTPEPHPWLSGDTPDGSCGAANGYTCNVLWGNCCNKNGVCGSLPSDCGDGCQPDYGNCKDSTSPKPTSKTTHAAAPSSVVPSTTVAALATSTMPCTGETLAAGLSEGLLGLCSYGCDYNHCPQDICVCTRSEAVAIPAPTGSGHGCPGTTEPGDADYTYYVDLCEFTCSHGYCPPGACKAC
ncbi:hypothetical protein CPLU01_11049 [Colletotrichum plurivorum]|uniref:Chitin-binding type-1 domain-containing protein n=1 Tax=Colletotrichum plurivorum TaxID=2175906 RepID=A0A8H6K3J0_9PEZI|nr:hypothetical protein CPLU01_11049 [Colletotrichum plurivorum]